MSLPLCSTVLYSYKPIVHVLKRKTTLFLTSLLFVVIYGSFCSVSYALQIIRDAQVEAFIFKISKPLYEASGVTFEKDKIYIYNGDEINAFVSRKGLFLSTGLIMKVDTPNEIIGVLAHELGHLKSGHLIQLEDHIENINKRFISTFLLGIGTALAVGLSGGNNDVISGAGLGVISLGSAVNREGFFSYRRHQEGSADLIAHQILEKTKNSTTGLINVLKKIHQKNWHLSTGRNYARTHPSNPSRIRFLEKKARASNYYDTKDPKQLYAEFELVQAKLLGFLSEENIWFNKRFLSFAPKAQKFAEAIYRYKNSQHKRVKLIMDALIKNNPLNAYLYEFYGQVLLESSEVKKSLHYFEKAIKLESQAPLIRVMYAKALINIGDPKALRVATNQLHKVLNMKVSDPEILSLLSMAYARQNKIGLAELYTAYYKIQTERKEEALIHAKKASQLLPHNTATWIKADDIIKSLQYR